MRGSIIKTAIALAIIVGLGGTAQANPVGSGSWGWVLLPPLFGGMQISPKSDDEKKDVDAVVDAMQSYYEKARTYSAEFSQVYEEINGLKKESSGVVWFKKGGKMRWDYAKPEEKYLFSNGDVFYSWEPNYNQYCRQDLKESQLPTALRFLSGDGDIREEFDVKLLEETDKRERIELTPKVPTSAYETIEFEVSKKSGRVEKAIIFDALGNMNTLRFKAAVINDDLPDENFEWEPPASATELCEDLAKRQQ